MNGLKRLFSRRRLYNDLSDEIQEHLAEKAGPEKKVRRRRGANLGMYL